MNGYEPWELFIMADRAEAQQYAYECSRQAATEHAVEVEKSMNIDELIAELRPKRFASESKTAVVTVRMPRRVKEKLDEAAHKSGLSLNATCLAAIVRLIQDLEKMP